uniref:Uncharacterized protein n=1 Tax=Elaeophora elaphi TaxID=1147741 RepID=A0A0R3S1D9_9BILA
MSQSVVNCNNSNNHHQQQQQSQQHQNSCNAYSIVAASTCSGRANYPATLGDNLPPPVGVSDGYLSSHSPAGSSSMLHSSCSSSSFVYPSNFFQPYYGLSPTLNEFNVLQMCCQPLFTEIASQGTDIAPTAESLYGFANRLHPITPTGKNLYLTIFLLALHLKMVKVTRCIDV